ncbi:phosphatidate cytidylyltransferase [Terrilactibacillus sp. BCM23-1]|uniref:Phosphatidate cytidylyltransferase n=1 Tax=Terrilactibacillus tamarindi TaxID=2599694 RepID=A0A6N8CSS1_9BACI|nr:phosphatidate cytidylyltransferase [Terrilactibacillus tamarindi]MTT32247.1 phosphatidate cytidylyltransferase [Terrilactibacillus tamarindi]
MKQRIMTAIIFGIVYLGCLFIHPVPFSILVTAFAVIAFYELLAMKGVKSTEFHSIVGFIFVASLVLKPLWDNYIVSVSALKMLVILLIFLFASIVFTKNRITFDDIAYLFLSAFYIGFSFSLLTTARFHELWLVLFIQIIMWVTDSGAYFVGRAIGKRKLASHISPNKTIEGSIGAVVVALIVAMILYMLVPSQTIHSFGGLLFITLIVSIFGQLGDLAESAIKRHYDIKDSGKILPGHGGIFDRFDSLLFVLPILYVFHFLG